MDESSSSVQAVRPARRTAFGKWLAQPGDQLRFWAKSAVAAGFIALVLSFVDWRESLLLLGNLWPAPVLFALVLVTLGLTLSTLKWQVLLAVHAVRLPFLRFLGYYWIGSFFSNLLLSTVGGDVVRLALMYKHARPTIVAATIVVERASGLLILLCLAALGLLMRPQYYMIGGLLPTLWLLVVGLSGVLGLALVLGSKVGRWIRSLLELHRFTARPVHELSKTAHAIEYYRGQIRPITLTFLLSILFYIEVILFDYSVILAVGGDIALVEVIFIAPLIALVSLVPISVNALGIAEGAFVLFYTQAGLGPEEALAAALLRRMLVVCYSLVGGVIWLRERPMLRPAP
jgi:uncharacterized protein (TIRG00374 family)